MKVVLFTVVLLKGTEICPSSANIPLNYKKMVVVFILTWVSVAISQLHRGVARFGDPQQDRKCSEALVNEDSQKQRKTGLLLSKYPNKKQAHCSIMFGAGTEASPCDTVPQLLDKWMWPCSLFLLPVYLIVREACVGHTLNGSL